MDIYQTAIRPLLFSGLKADPEWLHHRSIQLLMWLADHQSQPPVEGLMQYVQQAWSYDSAILRQTLWGLDFPNPLGLAAGFDKDGQVGEFLRHLGFGSVEVGTVTYHAQPGNPQPRLFRLLPDRAALNRMGFNNQGAAAMAERLAATRRFCTIPIGINLGKSKITPLENAAEDYLASFRLLKPLGDYFVVNVSSPNTPGLRSLQSTEHLERILTLLQQENQGQKPMLVKIAPDLEWEAIADVIALAQTYHLAGIIATNTTIRREGLVTERLPGTGNLITEEAGGISGAPLRQRATEIIRFIYRKTGGQLPIIGVGGIFTAADAWEKIAAGASLLQVYTGWIYEGPLMVRRALDGLAHQLETRGFASLAEAVGCEAHLAPSHPTDG